MKKGYSIKVDKKNKVVVVEKKQCMWDLEDMLDRRGLLYSTAIDTVPMPKKIIGKSRCSADDEWDEHYGVELAKERYRAKYRKSCMKALDKYIKNEEDRIRKIKEFRNKFAD